MDFNLLNIDYLFYLIYLMFKSIWGFFLSLFGLGDSGATTSDIGGGIFNFLKNYNSSEYGLFGDGLGVPYDGYSIFYPPHGGKSFDSFSDFITNFFDNPYTSDGYPSMFDIFFGGFNGLLYLLSFFVLLLIFFFKFKIKHLEDKESIMYDTIYNIESISTI